MDGLPAGRNDHGAGHMHVLPAPAIDNRLSHYNAGSGAEVNDLWWRSEGFLKTAWCFYLECSAASAGGISTSSGTISAAPLSAGMSSPRSDSTCR